uniref:Uncharacterized protein n=1 Tax=Eutreptiella gymnastica TaxID=73025 RepID=A0A7S1HRZ7_9EUGL|mmetsp:Transcript_100365/g.173395  ORF Transcript_100365/g.173395 Transcript_100365/m.173395 type:complete len:295 (+) Transcript_100365:56-940(+)
MASQAAAPTTPRRRTKRDLHEEWQRESYSEKTEKFLSDAHECSVFTHTALMQEISRCGINQPANAIVYLCVRKLLVAAIGPKDTRVYVRPNIKLSGFTATPSESFIPGRAFNPNLHPDLKAALPSAPEVCHTPPRDSAPTRSESSSQAHTPTATHSHAQPKASKESSKKRKHEDSTILTATAYLRVQAKTKSKACEYLRMFKESLIDDDDDDPADQFKLLVGDLIPGGSWISPITLIVRGGRQFRKAARRIRDKVKSNHGFMDFVTCGSADDVIDTVQDIEDVLSEDSAEELSW